MRKKMLRPIIAFLVFVLFLAVSGCGGSGSSAGLTTIAGSVSDGYVSGASVAIYSDAAMTTQIGSGSTDASGNFSFTLTVSTVPDIIYVKTTGGIDSSTGLAAPTMVFAGSYTAGSLNVTPITNQVFSEYQRNPSSGLSSAYTNVAAKLGISADTAKADVVADASAKSAMYEVLSAGTTGTTLPDGNYQVKFISFLKSDIGTQTITGITSGGSPLSSMVRTFNIVISSGNLTGTSDTSEAITGRVQGTTLIMDMASGGTLYRLAGEITFGAASGTYNKLSGGSITNGLFLATFTPSTVTAEQTTNLFTALANITSGQHYFATRDFLITVAAPFTSYGQITLSGLTASGFNYTDFTNNTVMDNNTTTETWNGVGGSASFFSQSRIYAFSHTYSGGTEIIYVIGAAGNRKCIGISYTVGGTVRSVVEVTLVKNTEIAPLIQSDTLYHNYVAVAHMGLLNQTRTANLSSMVFDGDQMQTPVFGDGLNTGFAYVGGQNIVMSGSTLMIKKCANFNTPLASGDYVMGLELYPSGAMSGTRVDGGSIGPINIYDYPSANVIFMRKDGTAAPDFSGTLNFLSRTMYSTDYSNYASDYAYGTITLDSTGSSATLSCTNGAGNPISATLTLEKVLNGGTFTGIIHLYGSLGGSNGYMDIYWPVGGKRATYVSSESATGNTFSVGEAFLTF
jgi:hypothetical protein